MENAAAMNRVHELRVLGDSDCETVVATQPQLLHIFKSTNDMRYKSDICRLVALYISGGFYVDADQLSTYPWMELVKPSTTFLTLKTDDIDPRFDGQARLANGLMGSTKEHPILKRQMDMIVDMYSRDPSFSEGLGPYTLTKAVQKGPNTSFQFFWETNLLYARSPYNVSFDLVPRQNGPGDCQWIMCDNESRIVIFYTRMAVDSDC